MSVTDVNKKAFDYFDSGFSCAEAMFRAVVEIVNPAEAGSMTKIATGFAGGVGGTHEELCGALAGGIMALGYLTGRTEPGADNQPAKDIAAALRQCFIDKFGATKCQAVLDLLGPQENSMKCKRLTGELAGDLYRMLQENGYLGQGRD
jgi:C_GCAxxG_C_C family probable redox protein